MQNNKLKKICEEIRQEDWLGHFEKEYDGKIHRMKPLD